MIRYRSRSNNFIDGATATDGVSSGTIVAHVPTTDTTGFIILEDTSAGTFTAGYPLSDDGGGSAVVAYTIATATADPVIARFARNTDHVSYTYEANTYDAFPFNIGVASFAKNQFRSVDITFSNVLRLAEALVRRADGFLGARITLKVVWAGDLSAAPAFEEQYEVRKTSVKHDTVIVTCGQDNFLMRGFPRFRYSRKRCRFRFKSDSCGYAGASTSCNRYIDGCITSSNVARFGGFPAIPGGFFSA